MKYNELSPSENPWPLTKSRNRTPAPWKPTHPTVNISLTIPTLTFRSVCYWPLYKWGHTVLPFLYQASSIQRCEIFRIVVWSFFLAVPHFVVWIIYLLYCLFVCLKFYFFLSNLYPSVGFKLKTPRSRVARSPDGASPVPHPFWCWWTFGCFQFSHE